MPAGAFAPLLVLAGMLAVGVGLGLLAMSGAQMGIGRRLGAAREVQVGDLVDAGELPRRPVRVAGRVRCADPLHTADGEQLVAFHRDVEIRLPRMGWRIIERLRNVTPQVTCSIGVASWDFQESAGELFERADQALYAAKAAGRNRYVAA